MHTCNTSGFEGCCCVLKSTQVLLVQWSTEVLPCYQAVDLFSGVGNIVKRYRAAGLASVEYDFILDPSMDFISSAGFAFLEPA